MQAAEIALLIIIGFWILKELLYIILLIREHCCQRRADRSPDVELGIHPSWKHKKASELKDHLDAWLKETRLPAGIDFDDHTLFILMPEDRKHNLMKSLRKEIKQLQDVEDCYKIITHQGMSIGRDQDYVGAGSSIYYIDAIGNPVRSSFGLLLENVNNHKRYILTTTHLKDKRGSSFYFSNGPVTFGLGVCVAHVCQTQPVIEACLVELEEDIYDRLSAFLSINGTRAEYVIRGPYRGDMCTLLAEPKEVLKAGGKTGLTRGRMKSADFDFDDPETGNRLYGAIVTLPTEENFADRGDSGAVICTSTCQAFTVDSWYNVNRAQNSNTYVVPSANIQTDESEMLLQAEGVTLLAETSTRATKLHANDYCDVKRHAEPCDDHQLTGREIPRVVQSERQIISYGYHTIPPEHEVMAHEALSVHNFGFYPWKVDGKAVRASLSFKLDPAIKLLQEQIHGTLVLVPLLRGSPL